MVENEFKITQGHNTVKYKESTIVICELLNGNETNTERINKIKVYCDRFMIEEESRKNKIRDYWTCETSSDFIWIEGFAYKRARKFS